MNNLKKCAGFLGTTFLLMSSLVFSEEYSNLDSFIKLDTLHFLSFDNEVYGCCETEITTLGLSQNLIEYLDKNKTINLTFVLENTNLHSITLTPRLLFANEVENVWRFYKGYKTLTINKNSKVELRFHVEIDNLLDPDIYKFALEGINNSNGQRQVLSKVAEFRIDHVQSDNLMSMNVQAAAKQGNLAFLYSYDVYATDLDGDGRFSKLRFVADPDTAYDAIEIEYKAGIVRSQSASSACNNAVFDVGDTFTIHNDRIDQHELIFELNSSPGYSLCGGTDTYNAKLVLYARKEGDRNWSREDEKVWQQSIGFELKSGDQPNSVGSSGNSSSNPSSGGSSTSGGSSFWILIFTFCSLVPRFYKKFTNNKP